MTGETKFSLRIEPRCRNLEAVGPCPRLHAAPECNNTLYKMLINGQILRGRHTGECFAQKEDPAAES